MSVDNVRGGRREGGRGSAHVHTFAAAFDKKAELLANEALKLDVSSYFW